MSETIKTNVNGNPRTYEVDLGASALEVIRDQEGLTGTKLVCGTGVCGACTVLVDNEPVCSCLLPATQLEGKQVQTVEYHDQDNLHPIQRAFMACDGLQCGYCTPGFINEGIAFYEQWKKASHKQPPTREEVAEAMAGHLCRCGAYVGIYEAIQRACAGEFDADQIPEHPRVDSLPKVTGKAKYTADVKLPGQLTGKIFRSTYAHGTITKLDLSAARQMPGVKAVIRLLEEDVFYYYDQPLAAVAAETAAQAEAALTAIQFEYTPLPVILDPDEARKPDAPQLYADPKNIPGAGEGGGLPGKWEGNVRRTTFSLSASKRSKARKVVEKAASGSGQYFKGSFFTPTQLHTCLEPHCAVADWKDGKLVLYASTQGLALTAREVAKHYELPPENVRVYSDFIGGGFGSKINPKTATFTAISLSKEAGAPVAMILSRPEELIDSGSRPAARMDVEIGSNADGSAPAFKMDAYGAGGFSSGSNIADIAGMIYKGIPRDIHDYDVLTNFSPGCPFRGPSGPASCFSLEQAVDQLAHDAQVDPIDFRTGYDTNKEHESLYKWVKDLPVWKNRKRPEEKDGRFRTGIGVSFINWLHLLVPSTEVEVEVNRTGIFVKNAVQDMGQGSKSVLAKAVAEVFEISPQDVKVVVGDSILPYGPTSGGSRTATSIYPAAKAAARKVKDRMIGDLAKQNNWKNAAQEGNGIRYDGGKVRWQEAWEQVQGSIKEKVKRGGNAGMNPLGLLPLGDGLRIGKKRGRGCYVIEVEVDTLLGKIRVTNVWGAMRIGKIFVPAMARSQCYGGVIQGIGYALYEDRYHDPNTGQVLTRGLEDYKIPGIGDIPEMQIDFLEEGFEFVKEKGIGLAELATMPVAAAVANAVFNATGFRPDRAPILPENLIQGLSV